jgi:hypothetical protein
VGRILLVGRLVVRDLRRRRIEAALLLLAIMAATTTLTLGLVLRDAAATRTRAPGRRPADPTWSPASTGPRSDAAPASVDQPELIEGGWVSDGGVVVEPPSPTRSMWASVIRSPWTAGRSRSSALRSPPPCRPIPERPASSARAARAARLPRS